MFWQDIFVNKMLTRNKVISSISKVFNIDEKMVKLIKEIEEITKIEGASIICQTYKGNTEFPLRLSIYIVDEKIIPKNERLAISQISREFGCDILMSDDSNNPYTMSLIGLNGSIEQVSINIEKLDDSEELYLE